MVAGDDPKAAAAAHGVALGATATTRGGPAPSTPPFYTSYPTAGPWNAVVLGAPYPAGDGWPAEAPTRECCGMGYQLGL